MYSVQSPIYDCSVVFREKIHENYFLISVFKILRSYFEKDTKNLDVDTTDSSV